MNNTHYFTNNSTLQSERKSFTYVIDDNEFKFTTDIGVFCPDYLDQGSEVLIKSTYKQNLIGNFLDLGCGYGPIGIVIKRFNPDIDLYMVDINDRACELAKVNLKQNKVDGQVFREEDIENLHVLFDTILLNPPIKSGKSNIFSLYEKSFSCIKEGGRLIIVISKRHGAMSSLKKLKELFNSAEIISHKHGYQIIEAIK